MPSTQRDRIQALLAMPKSPFREELAQLAFDALVGQPVSVVVGTSELTDVILAGLASVHVEAVSRRHVLPAVRRVQAHLTGSDVTVRDFLSPDAESALRSLVAGGKGPRFGWLKGAVEPADMQELIAPIVQQVLTSFVAKLPLPGLGGSGRDPDGPPSGRSGGGGLVGKIGKQFAKSASQLAGGLGLQQIVRDFSQSAANEVRQAIADRLKSDEGKIILRRMRERVLERVLKTKVSRIVDDWLRAAPEDVARVAEGAVAHAPEMPVFRAILAVEIQAVLDELGARPIRQILEERGLLAPVQELVVKGVEEAVTAFVHEKAFADWLDRLLAESASSVPESTEV